MSVKGFFRKLAISFGVLMFFLAIDIGVAWYLYPKAATPAQAVKMEATHLALEIFAKTMRAQLKKEKDEQAATIAAPATAPAPAAPVVQPPKQPAPQAAQPKPQQPQETQEKEEAPATPPTQPVQPEQPQQQTDTTTKLDDVQVQDNNILVYKIVADANGADFDYVMQQMRAEMFPADCSKPEYSKLMEYGIGIMLDFQSQDGTKHEQIMFTPQLCGFEPIPPSQQQQPPQ